MKPQDQELGEADIKDAGFRAALIGSELAASGKCDCKHAFVARAARDCFAIKPSLAEALH